MTRSIAVFGDSISTFEGWAPSGYAVFYDGERARAAGLHGAGDTWWGSLARALDAEVLANASYSGSMVSGAGFPAGSSCERSNALLGPAGEQPTDVFVFMGTNDYGWGSAYAQAAGRSAATPPCTDLTAIPAGVAGGVPDGAIEEFASSYALMLTHMRAVCPNARIHCLGLLPGRVRGCAHPTFAWNLRGVPMDCYNDAIARVCMGMNVRYLDIAAYGLDYEALDGTHPTSRGMAQIAALVLDALGECGLDDAGAFYAGGVFGEGRDAWASGEICPGRCCLGCAHAKGTGNAWYCVCQR